MLVRKSPLSQFSKEGISSLWQREEGSDLFLRSREGCTTNKYNSYSIQVDVSAEVLNFSFADPMATPKPDARRPAAIMYQFPGKISLNTRDEIPATPITQKWVLLFN